jgi:hypothetical protein
MRNTKEDFWKFVQKSDTCWLWSGTLDRDGYGSFWYEGKNNRAHRFIFELIGEPLASTELSLHSCDVRNCVNPEHLRPGTQHDNVHDAIDRKRFNKFSDDMVAEVKRLRSHGFTVREVAGITGISKSQVARYK